MSERTTRADLKVIDGGSAVLLQPLTAEAEAWIEENVDASGFQPYWPMVACEARYAGDLLAGMEADGLTLG